MADKVARDVRSRIMGSVRSKGTKPEIVLRSNLHRLGYRYRLHGPDLPGCPDLVFPSRRKVVFVHGCFWHIHAGCARSRFPASNRDYWIPKLERNRRRDRENQAALIELGWGVLVVWECELRDLDPALDRVAEFLGSARCI